VDELLEIGLQALKVQVQLFYFFIFLMFLVEKRCWNTQKNFSAETRFQKQNSTCRKNIYLANSERFLVLYKSRFFVNFPFRRNLSLFSSCAS